MRSVNPATGKLIKTYQAHNDQQIDAMIQEAEKTFSFWRTTNFDERARLVSELGKHLMQQQDHYALLISEEMGKVIHEAKAEIQKCAWVCQYYAENSATFLAENPISTQYYKSFVSYQPMGVILAIMPWNFPFWQVIRFAVPALMAGNVCLLRHALNVSGCALAIEQLFYIVGFPKGCFQTLLVSHETAAKIIGHSVIQGVALTGSTEAGRQVAKTAGASLKKTVLELGGSDPYIILDDADLERAAKLCATSRLLNAGQSCIAAKRFLVMNTVYDNFIDYFMTEMHVKTVGDPLVKSINIGPMASCLHRDRLHQQVVESIQQGANCVLGGKVPEDVGAFYPPTVLTNVKPGMIAFDQELFGPVASITKVYSESEAIKLANQSPYGLGSAIFTQDIKKAEYIAKYEIESGICFVNDFVVSDPRLPFGGVKKSGYGRELSELGIKEFTNAKTIAIVQ